MADEQPPRKRRHKGLAFGLLTALVEAVALHHRTGRFAGRVVVRCHSGHLYSTLWIPGASVKSVRLGPWRIQRCPVGHHWSIVTPVRRTELSPWRARRAQMRTDLRVP